MRVQVVRRDEHVVGKYRVTLLYDSDGRLLGAMIQSPRSTKPIYVAVNEPVTVKLPKNVKSFLAKMGFKVEG